MTDNLNKFNALGAKSCYYAVWHATSSNYISGTNSALAAGEDSGMDRLLGLSEFTANTPAASSVGVGGDNGNISSFMVTPADAPSGNTVFGAFDQTFDTIATDREIKTEGPHDLIGTSSGCNVFVPVFIVVNSPAYSQESGSIGEAGYQVTEFLYVFAQGMSVNTMSLNTPHDYTHSLTFNDRGVTPWGETITNGNYGRTRLWKIGPYWSTHPVFYHTYDGTGGAAQTFTLDKVPYADDGDALQIWDNGSKLAHTTNYTVSATTGLVTFVGTDPASGHFGVCKVMYNESC